MPRRKSQPDPVGESVVEVQEAEVAEEPMVEQVESVEQVVAEDSAQDARAVFEWLSGLGAGQIKVALARIRPRVHKGFPCGGSIDKYEHNVTLEEIAETHGGGEFQIRVMVPNPKHGRPGTAGGKQSPWIFAGQRTFTIAGHPKLENLIGYEEPETQASQRQGGNGTDNRAMDLAEVLVKEANDRARRVEEGGRGVDEVVAALTESYDRRFDALTTALSEKDKQIIELLGRPPDTKKEDRLLDLVGSKEDTHARHIREMQSDHAAQLAAVRTAHEAEMRQVRDFSREELSRYQDRFDRQVETMTRAHDRELGQIQNQHTQSLDTLRLSYDTRIDALNTTIRRAEADLAAARTELAALRAKKDLSPAEQLQGLVAIKAGFDSLMPAAAEPEEQSGFVRAIEAVANSEVARGIASRIMAGPPAPPPPAEEMVRMRRKDGAIVEVPKAVVERAQAARAAGQTAHAGGQAPALNPKEVAMALSFMEQAYRNGTPPEVLAASARNMIPAAILGYLKSEGVDHFLNNVARIQDGSPLSTVDGRMYVRKVAKFLLEGTTLVEEEPAAEPEVPETKDEAPLDIEDGIGEDSIEVDPLPD